MSTYDKIETDNPLLDEIIYNCKLIMRTMVIKDQEEADKYETLESSRDSDIYIAILENRAKMSMFDFDESDCIAAGVTIDELEYYEYEYDSLSDESIQKVTDYLAARFKDEFEETNNYYRKITGNPAYGEPGLYVTDDMLTDVYIVIDTSIPIHEMTSEQKKALASAGIIDKFIEMYPQKYYLKYITCDIDLYTARKAGRYELLYMNPNINQSVTSQFKELFDKNRLYFSRTMDNNAYRYFSEYYDKIIMFLMTVQTTIDCVAQLPDFYTKNEIFDMRTCEYFFESNGVKFFADIPIKYQKRLIKNINKLIKLKSTYTCIIDITKLFGFDNIKIFKYYLMKSNRKNPDGSYVVFNGYNYEEAYNLKFIKVPYDETLSDNFRKSASYLDYDMVTMSDPYWDGPYSHSFVKEAILKKDFNIEMTKYMSVKASFDLSSAQFDSVYFMNMIMYSGIKPDNCALVIPEIDEDRPIPLFDCFVLMLDLLCHFNDISDNVLNQRTQYLTVKGFDFDRDLVEISNYLAEKGYTLDDLGADGFITIASNATPTIKQLVEIFINNKNIYNHIVNTMYKVNDKNLYDCYKKVYNSIMVTDLTNELFTIPALGKVADTYTEYLQNMNGLCYRKLQAVIAEYNNLGEKPSDETKNPYYACVQRIIDYLYEYINTTEITSIFAGMTSQTAVAVSGYLYEVINFFKSYKTTMLDVASVYVFDADRCFMIDMIKSTRSHQTIKDTMKVRDVIHSMNGKITLGDRYTIEDEIYSVEYNYRT